MARFTIPGQNVPIQLANGQMNPDWYPVFKFIETLQPLSDIDNPSFDEAPLTPGSTSATVTSRTVTDGNNSTAGVDAGTDPIAIGYKATDSQTWFDSFTIIKNILNAQYTNDANLDAAVDALNTRTTDLENKLNDVISDLDTRFP